MRWIVLAVAVGALASSPAAAQDAELRRDARCVLVTAAMASNPKFKDQAMPSLLYFMGRIDGRGAGDRLETLMVSELQQFNEKDFPAEATRCGELLRERGETMKRVGAKLQALGSKP